LLKRWFYLSNAIFSNRAATPDFPATLYLESILNEAKGARTAIAPQQPFLLLFALSSLPCVSKAASSAPKIIQKFQAEGCYAVFSGLHFSRQRKTRRQYFVYYQGFFCRIGKCSPLKTCWGSSSLCLRRFYPVHYVQNISESSLAFFEKASLILLAASFRTDSSTWR